MCASVSQTKIVLKVFHRYWWLSKCFEKLVAPKIRKQNGGKNILEYLQLTFKKARGGLANQVNAGDRTCPHTAVHQMCSMTETNYVMKCLDSMFRVLTAPSPSYFLPFPSSTFKVLWLIDPRKTMLLSSSRGTSWACSVYRACVSIIQQGPSPILEIAGDPSSSQPAPAWAPCPSPWSCGGRDTFRVLRCFLIHCSITRQHKSLGLYFSFSVFIEKIQCLENSWYYLMIFWWLRLIPFVMLSED